ncbi:MAG TPA: SDR family NAD(P)-dependent oxidoreductase [Hyphomicrobiales bacterium]|nr:SDR family NAD(P)-dependent oxidoreductase [Hyphomicrobiales bacterium]
MEDVEGKVAFITGGASGIGFGMARVFLGNGMKVAIADLQQDRLDEAAAALAGTNQGVHFMRVDVTDRAAMAAAADEVERVFGKVHVVCNNAGVGSGLTDMDEAGYDDWDFVFGTNVFGVINGIVSFTPKIKAHGEGGHIVNTSSMAGLLPLPGGGGIYSASKFAVRGISDSLRLNLKKHGIGVSVLCPGLTRSRLMESHKLRPAARSGGDVKAPSLTAPSPANSGMDPLEVGERVLQGIRDDDAYILPHGEFKDEVAGLFAEIVDGFPEGQEIDPGRLAFEEIRRRRTEEAKRG